MSAEPADLTLDSLADALAPRIFERLKKLAEAEREQLDANADTLEFLEGIGWRRDVMA